MASGGAVGSVLRYAVAGITQRLYSTGGSAAVSFPVGTLVVNVTGSFLIGLLMGLAESRAVLTAETRLLLVTGLLGGYTTFSAFSLETLMLFRAGQTGTALSSVVLQVLLGVAAAFAGFTAGMPARP
ncbi:MAG: fluoride efflux transporter CrcB [Gammaproteobacteria bacterium]|nr:fluoride efflux transporter CrcB [Gammaproteobacteria bacterium]